MKLTLFLLILFIVSIGTHLATKSYMELKMEEEISLERSKQDVINYFNEICLGSEYGMLPLLTYKFKGTSLIYLVKNKDSAYTEQLKFLNKVLVDFNSLTTDGFKMSLTNDSAAANSHLYLCSDKQIKNRQRFKHVNDTFFGYFDSSIKNNYIVDAEIFINTDKPLEMQKVAILEEVIQSVGFFNDSDLYLNSIFFQHKYSAKFKTLTLSDLDKKIIRILYNPLMKTGLNRLKTVDVIREILSKETPNGYYVSQGSVH